MKKSWKEKRSRRFFVLMAGGLLVLALIVGGILSFLPHETLRSDSCGSQVTAKVIPLQPGVAQPTGDRFYAGSDSYLYAMSGMPPRILWCRHFVNTRDGSSRGIRSLQQSGGQVYASMVDGSLVDVDGASGTIRWSQQKVISYVGSFLEPPAVVVAGVVYGGYDQVVSALNARDGSVRWRYTLPEKRSIKMPLSVAGGLVYFGAWDSGDGTPHLYAVDASTGSLRWDATWPNVLLLYGPALVVEGRAYVVEGGDIYALDAKTGKQLWRASGSPEHQGLIYSQGMVYGESETGMKAFDAESGRLRWFASGNYGSPLLVENNLLYAGPASLPITAFDARTGKRLWQMSVALGGEEAVFKSTFVRNGTLYIAAQDIPLGTSIGKNLIHILDAQTGQEEYYITLATEGPAGTELYLAF